MSEPVLRPGGRDEEAAIRAVIAESFPDNPKARADVLAWQYWDNPFGHPRVWVWEDAGRIVAHYSAYPVPAVIGGEPALLGIGVDAAVAPDYQGRGLFKPLARALYQDCGAHGFGGTVCFPNQSSIRGITAVGWVPVARLRTRVLALDDAWLAERFHLPLAAARAGRALAFRRWSALGRDGGIEAGGEVAGPPGGLDELWAEAGASTANGIARRAAWWQWRYAARPDHLYRYFEVRQAASGRLAAAAVTSIREGFGGRFAYVLELLATGPGPARALTRSVALAAAGDGAVGAALVAVAGSQLDARAAAAGFRRLPARLEPKPLWFGVVAHNGALSPATVPWEVAWGDLDHI